VNQNASDLRRADMVDELQDMLTLHGVAATLLGACRTHDFKNLGSLEIA
jgi:hypothetical protein